MAEIVEIVRPERPSVESDPDFMEGLGDVYPTHESAIVLAAVTKGIAEPITYKAFVFDADGFGVGEFAMVADESCSRGAVTYFTCGYHPSLSREVPPVLPFVGKSRTPDKIIRSAFEIIFGETQGDNDCTIKN